MILQMKLKMKMNGENELPANPDKRDHSRDSEMVFPAQIEEESMQQLDLIDDFLQLLEAF